jgi:hypothetical protein
VLRDIPFTSIRVFLNPQLDLKEAPLDRFYRFVYQASHLLEARALFSRIPHEPVLTLGLDGTFALL